MIKLASISVLSLALMYSVPSAPVQDQSGSIDDARPAAAQQATGVRDVDEILEGIDEVDRERPARRRFNDARWHLSAEMIANCLEVARDVDAELATRLEVLRENSSSEQFEQALRRNARHLISLSLLRERNPDLYDLKLRVLRVDTQINDVVAELRQARVTGSIGNAEALEGILHALVETQMSHSIEANGRFLSRMNEQMDELTRKINEEATNFKSDVEQRLKELLEGMPETPVDAAQTDA